MILPLAAALLCGLSFWSGLRGALTGRRQATFLNLTVWLLLVLMIMGLFPAALAVGFAVLAWAAFSVPGRISIGLVAALGLGAALGALRLADGFIVLDRATSTGAELSLLGVAVVACGFPRFSPRGMACAWRATRKPRRSAAILGELLGVSTGAAVAFALGRVRLILVYSAAVVLGKALERLLLARPTGTPVRSTGASGVGTPPRARCVMAGMLTAAALVLLCRAAGETTSLSTVDVRAAFALVESRFGLILAVIAVTASQSVPALGLLLGLRSSVARLSSDSTTDFSGGLAAALVGQAAVGILLVNSAPNQLAAALALGLSVRVIAETLYLFLGLAVLIVTSRPTSTRRD